MLVNNSILRMNINHYLVFALTLIILIMSDIISKEFLLVISLLTWIMIYTINKKKWSSEFALLRTLILSVPLSFVNIFGQSYEALPLSWFNVFIIILALASIVMNLLKGKFHFNFISIISLLLIGVSIIPLLVSINFIDAFKQYLNIIVSFVLIILGSNIRHYLEDSQKKILTLDYIFAVRIAAIGVVVQFFYVKVIGKEIGNYIFLGGYRDSYGFLFSDFSFLSLYLASGAMMVYFLKRKYVNSNILWIIEMAIFIVASIMTSARTGIFAFVLVFCVYSLIIFSKMLLKGSINAVYIFLINIIIVVTSYIMLIKVRGIRVFGDSGRSELNESAFKLFLENPFMGIGFGNTSYGQLYGTIPHNLLYQSLAQGGVIYTIPLVLFLCSTLWLAYKRDIAMFQVILCVLIGSLFIPDIFNSRFLAILFLLFSIRYDSDLKKQVN